MVIATITKAFTSVFGSRNDRLIKTYRKRAAEMSALEGQVRKLTDGQLRAKTAEFRQRLEKGEKIGVLVTEALAAAREVMDRAVGIRNIFNPEHKFDASALPAEARRLYQQTAETIAATPGASTLGCRQQENVVHQWDPVPAWMQVEIPVELYEAVREHYPQSRPPFRARPFDVQLVGGMVLSEGRIAEMKTGEGKTIVAPLACYLACVESLQCHVVTVNDYLVQRDRDWVFPFYYWLDLTVGAIHPYHMQDPELKQQAYTCAVLYGTNSELGFDYLRDNMKLSTAEQVQKRRDFCIIDEVDSILIDEARTPLIISGPARSDAPRYALADQLARHLMQKQREWDGADLKVQQTQVRIKGLEGDIRNTRDSEKVPAMKEEMRRLAEELPQFEEARDRFTRYYEVEREKKQSHLTHEGIAEAQRVANVGSFYVGQNMDLPHLLENALRAHVVYRRDYEYVVEEGEVIIVDEFTGRKMIGRQWSDGLHQAVEAKEKVKIKEETQTLATVTIQNFFRLYKRLAGMTGTAATEGAEFHDIYKLEVVQIPTNVPVIRVDRDDLIYTGVKDKWSAILDEIKRMHDVGRPVLVGTTSVEASEMLSQMLTKRYAIPHAVLNAKQHEKEALIVAHAGELGAVMIATNMAGRGTDIKLTNIARADLVRHWQQRNLLPREAKPEMADEELVRLSYRHQARLLLDLKPAEVEALSDAEVRLRLLRLWVADYTYYGDKADKCGEEECLKYLDGAADFLLHRLKIYGHTVELGGLHIVGTERHESRRIDNQLRGRSGRQGDQGSSRFFISLEDDLMKLFAGPKTLALLSRFGMKEGDAIEHRMITRSVERAQRKVEERNYEIRKQLLEYDEVMEYQRNTFYGLRQEVLEGRKIQQVIFDYIGESVEYAVVHFLAKDFVAGQIAEWARQELNTPIEAYKLETHDAQGLIKQVRDEACAEASQTIDVTLGEYMSRDVPQEEWDLRSLASWAMSQFSVDLKLSQLRQMNPEQVKEKLVQAAHAQILKKDLDGLGKFLAPHFAEQQLALWAKNKFEIDVAVVDLAALGEQRLTPAERLQQTVDLVLDKARAAYGLRELAYPVETALEWTFNAAQANPANAPAAAAQLCAWANRRYDLGWQPEAIAKMTAKEMQQALLQAQEAWLRGGKLEALVEAKLAGESDPKALAAWVQARFEEEVEAKELADPEKRKEVLVAKGRAGLRGELTALERYVLLQILDMAWKDHLYAMDALKDSVGLRGYAEQDPRIEYKREGANMFQQMRGRVRDQVTDLIFRVKLAANAEMRSVYAGQQAQHAEAGSLLGQAREAAGTEQQREDLQAAEQAGGDHVPLSRKQRRAAAAQHGHGHGEGDGGGEGDGRGGSRPQFKERRKRRR